VSDDSARGGRATDDDLDETIEESFPASDPPSHTGETGTRLDVTPPADAVTDNRDAHQFELVVDGETSVLVYQRTPTSLILVHTEVPPPVRGRHLAATLAQAAINAAHAQGLRVIAVCPFVKAYMRRHHAR
jgi:predicted GNAT family acetyltransferase